MAEITPAPTPEEAAAVIAAIEQFLRDNAPVVVVEEERQSDWVRVARLEAVDRDPWRD